MKTIFLLLFFLCISLADNKLLAEAQKFEDERNFKKAMEIYKKLALENKNIDSNTQKQLNYVNENIKKSSNKIRNSTIEQILSSSFDIYAYKDNYFLPFSYDNKKRNDRDQNESKFQFSIKKAITYDKFGLKETINFGYTQTSWWQTYSESAPFRESNYQPEIFVLFPYVKEKFSSLKAYKVSFIHESNGQGSSKSRSWNRLYLEGYFKLSNLLFVPRIWYRIPENSKTDDNPDIVDYLGFGDINILYAYNNNAFKLKLRNNLKLNRDNKGFAEFTWTLPFGKSKTTFAYIQVSSGYGDSLIDYDKEVNRASIGFSLSR